MIPATVVPERTHFVKLLHMCFRDVQVENQNYPGGILQGGLLIVLQVKKYLFFPSTDMTKIYFRKCIFNFVI